MNGLEEIIERNKKEITLYRSDDVLSVLSLSKATPSDYLVKTYFKIFDIQNGELYEKYQRRFSNIIFNNFDKISLALVRGIFREKTQEILNAEFRNVPYFSCIYPRYAKKGPHPVLVQYFKPETGIEHRILDFLPNFHGLSRLIAQNGILGKVVGYSGDFSYPDPGPAPHKSAHFVSLSILSNRGDSIRYLPYSDGFIDDLFDLLADYLPENVTVCLDTLGRTFLKMRHKTQFAENLLEKYEAWRNGTRQSHILSSAFAKCAVESLEALFDFFKPFQCLPRSIEALVGTLLQRYLLVLMVELYEKVAEITMTDNCALVYYSYLLRVRDLFKAYREEHFIPPRACNFFKEGVEEMVRKGSVHPVNDKDEIDALHREIFQITHRCYTCAIAYIDPLLSHFRDFDTFSWALLEASLDEAQVMETYHIIHGNRDNCNDLLLEVRTINMLLIKLPLLEEETVVGRWRALLQNHGPYPLVTQLLGYLLALPASYDVIPSEIEEVGDKCKKIMRFNWRSVGGIEDVVGFFGGLYEEAVRIVEEGQILPLVE